jgi:hypothetical protein
MRSIQFILLFVGTFLCLNCSQKSSQETAQESPTAVAREYYQFKTYLFDSDAQESRTDLYLENAYLPALKRLNILKVGVFKPRYSEKDTIKRLHVLIPFSSMEEFANLDAELEKDSVYLMQGADYIKANYQTPPYGRIKSILLKAFIDFPNLQKPKLDGPRADRIYELRSYESSTESFYKNKVDMFNAGGEVQLFEELEFNAVFYGEVLSGGKMPNLMYMTTFSDQESRDAHWQAFRDSPVWAKLKVLEQYQNNVSHIDIHFLVPTSYSDY